MCPWITFAHRQRIGETDDRPCELGQMSAGDAVEIPRERRRPIAFGKVLQHYHFTASEADDIRKHGVRVDTAVPHVAAAEVARLGQTGLLTLSA